MTLSTLIRNKKKEIASAWLEKSLEVYPEDSRRFFGTGKDKFANPVGRTLSEDINALLDAMVLSPEPEACAAHLSRTLKIRAVQEMRPADALGFIFLLKTVLKETLKGELEKGAAHREFIELGSLIDAMSLFAFEIYAKHREKVFEVRISDVKRQVSHLLKRSAFFTNDEEMSSKDEIVSVELKPRR